ncbi:hypothetical protein [Shimia abyssi]|uniref:Uncharacterized protein n=1 Tax=Shimia abyssi TaxID=1662395 RepID=A0A2P8FJ20_9RHOB|nr:hypothetical protein [Shimia abyssi]PSL21699.1 hypothetical protein CLV88_101123 [Shimia abyssi]
MYWHPSDDQLEARLQEIADDPMNGDLQIEAMNELKLLRNES